MTVRTVGRLARGYRTSRRASICQNRFSYAAGVTTFKMVVTFNVKERKADVG